jgi:hypothetical protein
MTVLISVMVKRKKRYFVKLPLKSNTNVTFLISPSF